MFRLLTRKTPAGEWPARDEALSCIPVRNPEVHIEAQPEGHLLAYPVQVKPWFRPLFNAFSTANTTTLTRKLKLDNLGSSVWDLIDDQRSVAEITHIFQQRHKVQAREAELAVTAYFRQLGQRGLLAMRQPACSQGHTPGPINRG